VTLDQLLILGVIFVASFAMTRYWSTIRQVTTPFRHTGGAMRDDQAGLSQIKLPPGWKSVTTLHGTAPIQATDRLDRRFLLVISESREDFTTAMTLEQYNQETFASLTGESRILELDGPASCSVGSFDAIQVEALVALDDVHLARYLHTVIAGDRAFHQVIAWAIPSAYDRAVFEQLREGFAELPGPKPIVRGLGTDPTVSPSHYEVH
jgi:hypothetical protein